MRSRWIPRIAALLMPALIAAHAGRAADIHDQLAACNDWLYLINPSGITLQTVAGSGFDGVVTDYSRD